MNQIDKIGIHNYHAYIKYGLRNEADYSITNYDNFILKHMQMLK